LGDATQFHRGLLAGGVMSGFKIKGWCPSALRPMASGDGLVVRLRPRRGRLSSLQASGVADLSNRYGNGLIDLTGRANLQIRGVAAENHQALVEALARLGLIDPDVETESGRNVLVAPFWREAEDTPLLAAALERALARRPLGLPEKFGFAVDCGAERVLAQAPADIRIERCADGGLLVRADGAPEGRPVAGTDAIDIALALARWFVVSGGASDGRGRMAAHIASGATFPDAIAANTKPLPAIEPPRPGLYETGALVGLAFGQMRSETLGYLAALAPGLRMTPWRMILAEGACEMPRHEGLVTRADDPLLRVVACTGAPVCPEARAETRRLAAALAPHIGSDDRLHVSGCAKGCAHPGPATITLVGAADGFDLVRHGAARDRPALQGLDPAKILSDVGSLMGQADAASL
jgi:precorrin-3B synthase